MVTNDAAIKGASPRLIIDSRLCLRSRARWRSARPEVRSRTALRASHGVRHWLHTLGAKSL